MSGVALHTQEGLGDFQKRVIGRAVRSVTICTVFGYISVFIYEGPLVFHMTAGA